MDLFLVTLASNLKIQLEVKTPWGEIIEMKLVFIFPIRDSEELFFAELDPVSAKKNSAWTLCLLTFPFGPSALFRSFELVRVLECSDAGPL